MTQVSFDPKGDHTPTKYSTMAFFPFFVWIFLLHTTLSGVYFNGKMYLHFVLNNISDLKIILQFSPLACK